MTACFLMKSTRLNEFLGNLLRNKTKYGNLGNTRFGNEIPDDSILTPINSTQHPCML